MTHFAAAVVLAALSAPPGAIAETVLEIPLYANDIDYDATRGQLWVSLSSRPAPGDVVVPIDPRTGALGAGIPVATEPFHLDISADDAFLYVTHFFSNQVHRIDLATRSTDLVFQTSSTGASDIAVHPANAEVVAISLANYSGSPSHAGVAIYDRGIQRPNVTPGHIGSDQIEFDASGDSLFGYDSGSSQFGFRKLRVDASGVTETLFIPSLFQGFSRDIAFVDAQLVHESGRSADPVTLVPNGLYPGVPGIAAVVVDPAYDAVYFIDGVNLQVFDRDRFSLRRTLALPRIVYSVLNATSWGVGKLAFTTGGDQLFIVDLEVDPTDSDGDGIVDVADNCPLAPNKAQSDRDADGDGDVCDAQPLSPRAAPINCNAELTRANAETEPLRTDIAQCVAAGYPDADGDGEPDSRDRCTSTAAGAAIDSGGCSQVQFCAAAGSAQCKRADWRNDEPTLKKPGDCAVVSSACAAQ